MPCLFPRALGCDMHSASFHRQHDLKCDEKTHSGSKPYTCNGSCGRNLTRKDALKLHQVWSFMGFWGHSLSLLAAG
ncbi:hypothetical protein IW262DRAFT_1412391 [Armillaria fumosa]|nr:hypothetical protein IW262DRAFT_1412391 [Armillaria fumosa]